jgi:hypothetical protein
MVDGDLITVLPIPPARIRAFRGSLKGRYSVRELLASRRRERRDERRRG